MSTGRRLGPETKLPQAADASPARAIIRPESNGQLLAKARESLDELVKLGSPKQFERHIQEVEVIRHAAKVAALSAQGINDWTRHKVDCERAAARCIEELRAKGELAQRGRPGKMSEARTFNDLEIDRRRVADWALLASIPSTSLDTIFDEANARGCTVSEAQLLWAPRVVQRREQRDRALAEWQDMPEYSNEDLQSEFQVIVHFACAADVQDFAERIGQKLVAKATRQLPRIWFPQQEIGRFANKRYATHDETPAPDTEVAP